MKEVRDGIRSNRIPSSESVGSQPLVLDIEDFKGEFSFDALFGNLVNELLPSFQEEEADSLEGNNNISGNDTLANGRSAQGQTSPLFPEVDSLLSMFKNSCSQLVELRKQIDGRLYNLKKDVASQDSKHRQTLSELEKGVDGLFDSFGRLDTRISSVGQTAAKIGDHLQSADSQRETASQTMELIKYLMEFNSSPGDLMELSPLFSDDSRVAEAASIAQKLRSFAEEDIGRQGVNATASRGLEVAVGNLQEYCNELENRLLSRFDNASQKRELAVMAECAKILSQFNRGTSAMQHYVGLRPMFDVEVMNADSRLVLGDQDSLPSPSNVARALSSLYKEITDTVRKESATIMAVFPSPNDVMSILVQRVMEDRVPKLLEKLLVKPSLVNPPPMAEGGLLLYLRMLAVGYDKTQELAKDLRSVGCGDLDIEDWEAAADLAADELLSSQGLPDVSKLTLEDKKVQQPPARRGRGTFSYQKHSLYIDQQSGGPIEEDLTKQEVSSSSEGHEQTKRDLKYGTRHALVMEDFQQSMTTSGLENMLKKFNYHDVVIRWINDTTVLAIFRTPAIALEACQSIKCPFTVRVLEENDVLVSSIPERGNVSKFSFIELPLNISA